MRLFVALEIPSAVRENLAALIKELGALGTPSTGRKARWVRPANLHVTLKFIGEVPAAKVDAIGAALATVRSASPVALAFRGVSFFSKRHLLILWAGLEASSNLQPLASDIDRSLERVGVQSEERGYTPHVTLVRSEDSSLLAKVRPLIDGSSKRSFGSFEAHEFHLIESKLKPSGAEYTTLRSFRFAAEA